MYKSVGLCLYIQHRTIIAESKMERKHNPNEDSGVYPVTWDNRIRDFSNLLNLRVFRTAMYSFDQANFSKFLGFRNF